MCGGKKSAFVVMCVCVCVGGHGYTEGRLRCHVTEGKWGRGYSEGT